MLITEHQLKTPRFLECENGQYLPNSILTGQRWQICAGICPEIAGFDALFLLTIENQCVE